MNHPPFPRGATAREIQAVQHLHQVADRHQEPEVRQVLTGALELIVRPKQGLEFHATFALGFADRQAVEKILDKCGNVNQNELTNFGAYRMRSIIEELVASDLFLAK